MWDPPLAIFSLPMTLARVSPKRNQSRLKGEESPPLIVTVACIFSQIRGTAKKRVGWISRRLSVTVSIDSAKLSWTLRDTRCQVEKTRSAT